MGGYTGIVVGEAWPAGVFAFLISAFSQKFGQQAGTAKVRINCEITTRNLRTAFGRFAYDPPMKYKSNGQQPLAPDTRG